MEDEDFTDRMVELLYGELSEGEEAAMRAHLETSEAAREAFDRLQEGHELASMLTLDDPPAGLLDDVLAAARDVAAERAPAAERGETEPQRAAAPREAGPEEDEGGVWGQFLQWIGGFATRPQFAMAMMLMLMIGIGMWYLPDFRGADPADSQAIIDPAPGDEVGPSALIQPSPPLDLGTDPRTGRILPREEIEEGAQARRPEPAPPVEEEASPDFRDAQESDESADAVADMDGVQPTEEGGEVITAPLDDPRAQQAQLAMAPGEGAATETERRPMAQAPSQAPAYQGEALTEPVPAMPQAAATEQGQASGAAARYARGMERYRAREYRAAAEDFSSVVERPDTDARRLLPSAMHHQARSEQRIGNCRAAVRTYGQLLQRYPAYSGAPEAMVEAAECHRRLGELTAARRLLEQASSQPSVASRARRELSRVAAQERAAERAEPAEASSVE